MNQVISAAHAEKLLLLLHELSTQAAGRLHAYSIQHGQVLMQLPLSLLAHHSTLEIYGIMPRVYACVHGPSHYAVSLSI